MAIKKWNWQKDDWPYFSYTNGIINGQEERYQFYAGQSYGIKQTFGDKDVLNLDVELILNEAFRTSEIEGELLDRDSLQSSIRKHFGFQEPTLRNNPREIGITRMMLDLYKNFNDPLTHETLFNWHLQLMNGRSDILIGEYRTHEDPMQVVSGSGDIYNPVIHYEAPPSHDVPKEMERFIEWFNSTRQLPPLLRAGIAHFYFLSIHPFEDGNGRVARALIEKSLDQHLEYAGLLSTSTVIQENKNAYYNALETQNKHNQIDNWLVYFADTMLEAQKCTIKDMQFLVQKGHFFDKYRDQMNEYQSKVITRILKEGRNGFKGGLSRKNYVIIAKVSAATATRQLTDLLTKGILTTEGKGRSVRYYLNLEFKSTQKFKRDESLR